MKRASTLATCLLAVTALLSCRHAWAKPTTPEQAQAVVQNWLGLEARPLGSALGGQVKEVQTFNYEGAPAYYVVFLHPAGLVIVPADDLVEPIVGFVSDATSYDPSPANPLGALVNRDIPGRVLEARAMEAMSREGAAPTVYRGSRAQAKWSGLLKPASNMELSGSYDVISDVRVAPLTQSRWNQSTVSAANPQNCYNYYTPQNYVCGCVATAMSQLMRYWQIPATGIGVNTCNIEVDHESVTAKTLGGDGHGGPYAWSSMVLDPANYPGLTAAQRQAIGALTYDAGLSVNMSYTSSGSGSNTLKAADAITGTFGYSNAKKGHNDTKNIPEADLYKMVDPNLQASYPVLFGIEGTSVSTGKTEGHAIVCDGYGYNAATVYHHLNMGWAGEDNAWYNLPTISLSDVHYSSIAACVYNVYTSGSGEIIAGRVTDRSSPPNPISGATVTATGTGGPYTATTDANGNYALTQVPSNTNVTITISQTGYTFPSVSVTTGTSEDGKTACGNLRGIDFTGAAYVSPYTITYTCDYDSLIKDFNTSPRDSITKESDLDYSAWYDISNQYYLIMGNNGASSCSTSSNPYSVTATWGPQSRQYPAVQVPDPSTAGGDTLTWQRERVVAVGQKHLGLSYQHHHIPDFNPYAVDLSWPASCPAVLVNYPIAGIDCSNFSSWNYNYGLGIKLDSALPAQSQTTTPIPGPGGTGSITPQVIGQGADYETLKSLLQTGDLLYIRAGTGKPVSHVIMWLGSIGKDPNESMPLVIDSHDNAPPIQDCNSVTIPPGVQIRPFRSNEYYFQQFDHAFRIIHGDSTSSVAHLLLSD